MISFRFLKAFSLHLGGCQGRLRSINGTSCDKQQICHVCFRQELATGLAGKNIDLVPVFDCLASGQPEVV